MQFNSLNMKRASRSHAETGLLVRIQGILPDPNELYGLLCPKHPLKYNPKGFAPCRQAPWKILDFLGPYPKIWVENLGPEQPGGPFAPT